MRSFVLPLLLAALALPSAFGQPHHGMGMGMGMGDSWQGGAEAPAGAPRWPGRAGAPAGAPRWHGGLPPAANLTVAQLNCTQVLGLSLRLRHDPVVANATRATLNNVTGAFINATAAAHNITLPAANATRPHWGGWAGQRSGRHGPGGRRGALHSLLANTTVDATTCDTLRTTLTSVLGTQTIAAWFNATQPARQAAFQNMTRGPWGCRAGAGCTSPPQFLQGAQGPMGLPDGDPNAGGWTGRRGLKSHVAV